MNTQMHADAMPDADPATLASPDDVAARIFEIICSSERFEKALEWRLYDDSAAEPRTPRMPHA
jgi:hypothetical protein